MRERVDLTINTYRGDAPFFERTYRHVVGQFGDRFATRRIVVDRSVPVGRFASDDVRRSEAALDAQLERLDVDRLVDVIEDVDWSHAAVEEVSRRYWGRPDHPTRCAKGSPLHQFLWALDRCDTRYVVHLDSDVLMHLDDGPSWVDSCVDMMERSSDVVFVMPAGGPPRATSRRQWLLGRPRPARPATTWGRSGEISTRYFLVDKNRFLERGCPIDEHVAGERLEQSITHTLAARGLEVAVLADPRSYGIHPYLHNENHIANLDGLIGLVESDRCPFRRTGPSWEIRTDGRLFIPWRLKLATVRRTVRAG